MLSFKVNGQNVTGTLNLETYINLYKRIGLTRTCYPARSRSHLYFISSSVKSYLPQLTCLFQMKLIRNGIHHKSQLVMWMEIVT
ncbi:hypothetical protein HanPI659440_Chr08g0308911 [Helianthus annuus]|nr:hypothetical protein HanPI659440_Chr08g0308911 [Helianthus annuus]